MDGTASTTRADEGARPSPRRVARPFDRWGAIAVALVLGAVLLLLGVPRLVASLANLPGDRVYAIDQDGRAIGRAEIDALLDSRLDATRWVTRGRDWTDIGAAYLMRARQGKEPGEVDKADLARAIEAMKKGLALAPANPFAWARLALIQYMHDGGPSAAMAEALRMSLLTGSYDERLVLTRLDLSFRAISYFSRDDRELILQQIRYAWPIASNQLVAMARDPLRRGFIAAAFANAPEILKDFEAHVNARRR